MESIHIHLRDADFDRLVHTGVPEAGDLAFAVKRHATTAGEPGFVVAFHALVDGRHVPVQAVTTLRAFLSAAGALRAWAEGQGMEDLP